MAPFWNKNKKIAGYAESPVRPGRTGAPADIEKERREIVNGALDRLLNFT